MSSTDYTGTSMSRRIRNFTGNLLINQGKWILLLAVVIAQVQIPIPVAHDHDLVDSHSTLATHLSLRHNGDNGDEAGLHWHWILPCQSDDEDGQDDKSLPTPSHSATDPGVAATKSNLQLTWSVCAEFVKTTSTTDATPLDVGEQAEKRSSAEVSPRSSAKFSCCVLCVIRC